MTPTPEELQTAWNENRGRMLQWRSLDINNRRELAKKRLSEVPDLQRWVAGIRRAADSDFCTGLMGGGEDAEQFIAGPDWLLKPSTLTLIEEGQYDNRGIEPPDAGKTSPTDLSYWNFEKDRTKLTPDQIKRSVEVGEILAKLELRRHKKFHLGEADALVAWILDGVGKMPPLDLDAYWEDKTYSYYARVYGWDKKEVEDAP